MLCQSSSCFSNGSVALLSRIFPKSTVRRVNRTVRRTQWKIAGTLAAGENRSRIRAGAAGAALAKIEERLPDCNQTQGRQKRDQRELHAIHLCFDTRFHWTFIRLHHALQTAATLSRAGMGCYYKARLQL